MAGTMGAVMGDPREGRLSSIDSSIATLNANVANLPSSTAATTQTQGDSSTKVATTAFVSSAVLPLASPYISGGTFYYYCSRGIATPATAGFQWPGDQYTIVSPWYVPVAITISNAGLEMKTGATGGGSPTLHMMIYSDNGSGYPGALFCDIGAVASDGTASIEYITGGVIKFTTPNVAQLPVPAGLYWIGARSNGVVTNQPFVYGVAGANINIPVGTSKPTTGAAFTQGFLHTGAGTTTPTDPFPAYGVSGAAYSANAPRMFVQVV